MIEQIGKIKLDLTKYAGRDLYCDGTVEDELLEIVQNYAETEYAHIIEEKASWPILYHLSPLRENIVDWIPMTGNEKVLEVGSGCGAITGALARKAAQVTCVDLSKKRSMINACRHGECDNVVIHVGNFKDIEPDLPCEYDFICLIGVFEYGQSYMGTEKPFEEFLNILLKHLAPGGRLVIAIENKLGMKYFAGCKEDHLGTYFSGIENYADGGGVRTFTKKGLEKIFAACQVKKWSFYYPYPDYKFMTTVYSDAYLPGKGELCNNLRNFDRDRMVLFNEKNAFDGVIEDDLFSVFANSYAVVIGEGFDIKYAKFSNDRAAEYMIRTEICRSPEGRIEVKKHPLSNAAAEHIRGMALAYENLKERYEGGRLTVNQCTLHEEEGSMWASFEYVEGTPLSELMDECLEKEDTEGFHTLFMEYMERISYNEEAPVADFDMVFSNILVNGDEWTVIDYEWTFGKAVAARELGFRAIYCYLLEDEKRSRLNLDLIMKELGISASEAEYYREQEMNFQRFVTGQKRSMAELREMIGFKLMDPVHWTDKYHDSQDVARVQIYEDYGTGFEEENSYFVPDACRSEGLLSVELKVSGNVAVLRIDPAMGSCMVKIKELLYNGKPVPLSNKKIFVTNGRITGKSSRGNGTYEPTVIFATTDPNLYIRVAELDRRAENILYASMEVAMIPQAMAQDMAGAVKRLI